MLLWFIWRHLIMLLQLALPVNSLHFFGLLSKPQGVFPNVMFAPCSLIEEGGDWDRRNRLKTYEGLYAMSIRDFKKAAVCFFDTMATFTSTELMDYQTFSKYSIMACLLAQDRKDIKKQVKGYQLCQSSSRRIL